MKSRAAFKVISWRNHLESLFPVTQKHLRNPTPVLLTLTFCLSADAALRRVGTPKGPHGSLFTHLLGNLLLCYAIRERKNIIYKRNYHKRSVMTWDWHVPEQLPLLQSLVIDKYTLSNFQNLEQNSLWIWGRPESKIVQHPWSRVLKLMRRSLLNAQRTLAGPRAIILRP